MILHDLKQADYAARIHAWQVIDPQLLFITNKSWFTLMVMSKHKTYEYGMKKILVPFNRYTLYSIKVVLKASG
jgi:hypothetical protein